MLETLIGDINYFKLYFFIILLFFLIPVFLLNKKYYINKYVFLLVLVFIFMVIHSLIFSFHQLESMKDALYALLVMTDLYLFINIVGCLKIYKYYSYLIILLAVVIISSSDIILLFFNSPLFYNDSNFQGIFQNSNTLALYLSVFISPYLFFFIFHNKSRKIIVWVTGFVLLNIYYIIFITRSRTSLVIFILVGIFIYISGKKNKIKKLISFCSVIIFFIVVLFFLENSINKYIHKGGSSENIFSTRTMLWNARINAIKEKPYTGWGYNVNEFTYIDPYHRFNKLEKGNTILSVIEEFGLFFGTIFIIIFTIIFYKAYKIFQDQKFTKYLAVTIIAVLLHSLLETWVFNFYSLLSIVFWMLIIASFNKNNKGKICN